MTAELIDGKKMAEQIKEELKERINALKEKGVAPMLVAVQVGEQPSSRVYVNNQRKSCEALGVSYRLDELPDDVTEEAYAEHVVKLNEDKAVTGIILQMPVPDEFDSKKIQSMIVSEKDVEGMGSANMGNVVYNRDDTPSPCTARAAVEIIKRSGVEIRGADVAVIGRSEIVGKPVALMMIALHSTVSVLHSQTKDLPGMCKKCDIIIVAAGRAGLVTGDMVREGALVVDVGINRVPVLDEDGNPVLNDKGKPKKKTVGDVDFDSVSKVAGKLTPVPGGVGPMTVAILLENVVRAAEAMV